MPSTAPHPDPIRVPATELKAGQFLTAADGTPELEIVTVAVAATIVRLRLRSIADVTSGRMDTFPYHFPIGEQIWVAPPPMPANPTMTELFGPIISSYSRADALRDGVLWDVTETAREAGFTIPVAMTSAARLDTVTWGPRVEALKPEGTGQDEAGRLWDVLWMGRAAIDAAKRRGDRPSDRLRFTLLRVPPTGRGVRPRLTQLELHIGPGDDAEPVITIGLPGED